MQGSTANGRSWSSLFGDAGGFELVVNGERLGAAEIVEFRRISGVRGLEPGHYWLDLSTGNMGFQGEGYPRFNVLHSLRARAVPAHSRPTRPTALQPLRRVAVR